MWVTLRLRLQLWLGLPLLPCQQVAVTAESPAHVNRPLLSTAGTVTLPPRGSGSRVYATPPPSSRVSVFFFFFLPFQRVNFRSLGGTKASSSGIPDAAGLQSFTGVKMASPWRPAAGETQSQEAKAIGAAEHRRRIGPQSIRSFGVHILPEGIGGGEVTFYQHISVQMHLQSTLDV